MAALALGLASLTSPALAQVSSIAEIKNGMCPIGFGRTMGASENYAAYVFGNCLDQVRGTKIVDSDADLSVWKKAELDTPVQLIDPRISPDGLTIVDVSAPNNSCVAIHETYTSALSMQAIVDVIMAQPKGQMKILKSEVGGGKAQQTYLYNPHDGKAPIVFDFYSSYAPNPEGVAGVVREATLKERTHVR